jgi:Ribbon-helix-helix protein, copG family
MGRPLFSVRLPVALAEALDRIAGHAGQSRSDLVETIIKGLDGEDRDMVVKTAVAGAPTEKRNLRLSNDALTQLKRLAGDRELADFLRRMLAYVVAMAPPQWHQPVGAQRNGHRAASARTRHGVRADYADDVEGVADVQAHSAALAVLAVFLIAALVALIAWLTWRETPPDSGPSDDPRGQLPPGPMRGEVT